MSTERKKIGLSAQAHFVPPVPIDYGTGVMIKELEMEKNIQKKDQHMKLKFMVFGSISMRSQMLNSKSSLMRLDM